MAPMTRSNELIPRSEEIPLSRGNFREASWQYVGSETRSDRDVSEEPPSSYDEEADMNSRLGDDEGDYDKPLPPLESPEDHEDILHPLREAANRVGREVERFAEVLDTYNPQRATAQEERHEMAIDLIDLYHGVATDTVDRLRDKHAAEGRKMEGIRWRKKMRGFKVTQSEDEIDLDDSDENGSPNIQQRTTLEDLERWEQEAQTWDLLRRLVHLRFSHPRTNGKASKLKSRQGLIHRYSTEREVWDDFLETDELALERRTVLQWLKDTAEESSEDIDDLVHDLQQNADRGDIIGHGWIHTKAAIKKWKATRGPQPLDPASPEIQREHLNASRTEPLVTQLDPDSATRQKRKLEVQDEYFERAIWLGCYELLRRGRSSTEIRAWCMERTEIWRAVSMSGFPGDDPDDDGTSSNHAASSLWRRMCFALARKGGDDDYERAVYGILSGDIASVEPVCRSWDDFVFTHYNALLRAQFDNFLQKVPSQAPQGSVSSTMSNFGIFDAVQFHGDPNSAGRRLIETLKSDPRTTKETLQPMKMLQGVLIANQFAHFIYQQGLALSKFANASGKSSLIPPNREHPENEDVTRYIALDDHDSLRVLTHVLLVFMSLGLDLGGIFRITEVENVIVAYISFLRLAGKEELIPLYCSQLSGTRKYAILCRNLIDVTDHEQRVTQIRLMRELGLDVQEFVKMQARFLLSDYPDEVDDYPAAGNFRLFVDAPNSNVSERHIRRDFFGDDPDERIDMLLIRSLEWYLLVDGLWSETFTVGTMLYLRFFKHMHLTAARMLASRIPSSAIAKIKTKAILGESLDFINLEQGDDEDLTEVLDGSADQKRLLRKHLLAEAKSYRELETLIECLDNIETVTSMASLMTEESTSGWQKGWRQQLAKAYQPTRASVQPLFKGWLLTCQQEGAEAEFKQLREAYLPETLLAYITTLQFGGNALTRDFLMECMEISALVAEDGSDLLDLFMTTGRMGELVDVLALASKALLLITSEKQSQGSRSKKMRVKGWTQELWSVKP